MNTQIQNTEAEEVVIRAEVQRITFHNPDNGYSVLQVKIAEQTEEITVVGTTFDTSEGAHMIIRGSYVTHPKYGKQLSASSITLTTPSSIEGIERYLGSGLIKGIGEKTAQKLVEEFGQDTFEVIYRDPEKVADVPGIGKHKASLICEAFAEQKDIREIMRFLIEHNISTGLASRIYERYGAKAVEILSRDPYLLARQMRGVGFATADSIALNLGIDRNAPQRLKAGIYYTLEKARDDGHCFLAQEILIQRAETLLGFNEELELVPHIDSLIAEDYFIRDEDAIYLKRMWEAESFVANFVAARCTPFNQACISEENVDKALKRAEEELSIKFSFEQRQAVFDATQHPLLVITGGPGCGKTTIIRALVSTFKSASMKIALAAPTGRAAQRMSQVCNMPAKTIHRLLRFDPINRRFTYGINQPLEVEGEEVDVVIIDETSMVDIQLAKDLFSAIPNQAILILVGDKDQLPSVGPGRVFADLIARQEIKSVSLSRLFRRSENSTINDVAHMINAGLVPDIPQPDGQTKVDAYFIPRKHPEEAAATIEALVSDQLPKKFGFEASEVCVLTPSNRGPLGTVTLNERLQNRLNPSGSVDSEQEITIHNQEFRINDRVCQRVNNYNIDPYGVFNGDLGQIYSIDKIKKNLVVEMWDGRLVRYEKSDMGQLSLAYAMTVHRSQGTEVPCVVLALHESHFTLLERQLIYTGVTRAKKLLVVVGSKKALALASKRIQSQRRCTLLGKRISNLLIHTARE